MDYLYYTPSSVTDIKAADHEIAKAIIENGNCVIQYLREWPTVGLAEIQVDVDSPTYKKRVICSGKPYGCMVAFLHEDSLYVGWSRRSTAKDEHGDIIESKPFSKKGGRHAAIVRGLNDTISFNGNHVISAFSGPIPASVRRHLARFIKQAEQKYERKAINVGYPELLPQAFEPTAKVMASGTNSGAL